jgi:methionyl-tRNA formyltransferase
LSIPIHRPANVNAREFVELAWKVSPDLGVSISYNQILRRPILDSARLGFVNFHAGKLPHYRGRNVVNWAIINGEEEIGLTAHFVDEGIDTGDIILQRTLPIGWTETYGEVLSRVVEAFPNFVVAALSQVASGQFPLQPQAHLMGTYFSGRADGDEWLDWSDMSLNLYNKIRAITHPGPGARTILGDSEIVVWSSLYDRSWPKYIATPGQVVGRSNSGVVVKTGDSTLVVQEVQVPGRECQRADWPIGTRFGINLMSVIRSLQSRLRELENQLSGSGKTNGATSTR